MSLHRTLERTHHWRQFLLRDPLPPGLPAALPAFLKQTGRLFLAHVPEHLSQADHDALDRWYWSGEGQETLGAVARRLWTDMSSLSEHAMPAHDARHAMFKVPAACLEYVVSEGVPGWERVGILGGLLHDYGRWAEERVFGEPGHSLIHARLSYLLGKELLDEFDMPSLMRQQILLAAIRHTSGATGIDPMPLKLTVSADRDQLCGAEIVLRLSHHMVNAAGDMSSFYGEKPGITVLTRLENFMFIRLPGPLFSRQASVDGLGETLANVVLMSEGPDESRARFKRRQASTATPSRLLAQFDWEQNWARAEALRCEAPAEEAPFALRRLLSAPNVAPSPRYLEEAVGKVAGLSDAASARLAAAFRYAHLQRIEEDARQVAELERIGQTHANDALMQAMASLVLRDWHGDAVMRERSTTLQVEIEHA